MITLGEAYNSRMGLNSAYGQGGDHHNGGGLRDGFCDPIDCVTSSLDAPGDSVLQQLQITDFLNNSYLQQGVSGPALPLGEPTCLLPKSYAGSYGSLSSMGFTQTDIDRSLLFVDDLSPIVDHGVAYSNSGTNVCNRPTLPFTALAGLLPGTSHGMQPSVSLVPQVAGECWVERSPVSASRGLKRGDDGLDPSYLPPKKIPGCPAFKQQNVKDVEGNWKRPGEQADHILRERQRRDDMTSKFLVLESLLPPGAKRDRSSIVDDSIEYVKNLHHRIKSLRQRKVEIKGTISSQNEACLKKSNENTNNRPGEPKHNSSLALKPPTKKEELSEIHAILKTCLEKMEVHADLPHQILIEMVCRPQCHFQSHVLQGLEMLHLDILQCTITKVAHRLICVIATKPQEQITEGAPTDDIISAIKYVLGSG